MPACARIITACTATTGPWRTGSCATSSTGRRSHRVWLRPSATTSSGRTPERRLSPLGGGLRPLRPRFRRSSLARGSLLCAGKARARTALLRDDSRDHFCRRVHARCAVRGAVGGVEGGFAEAAGAVAGELNEVVAHDRDVDQLFDVA